MWINYEEYKRRQGVPEWIWCPVANVKEIVESGPEGEATVYRGLKQFRPGAKLYVFPGSWCFGRQTKVHVLGKPRKSDKLIYIAVTARHLENYRVKQVYDKRVIRKMAEEYAWDDSDKSREWAQQLCDYYNTPRFWESD